MAQGALGAAGVRCVWAGAGLQCTGAGQGHIVRPHAQLVNITKGAAWFAQSVKERSAVV